MEKKDNAMSFWIHQIKDSKYQTATEHKNNYTSYFRWDNRSYIQTNEKLEDIFWRTGPKEAKKSKWNQTKEY